MKGLRMIAIVLIIAVGLSATAWAGGAREQQAEELTVRWNFPESEAVTPAMRAIISEFEAEMAADGRDVTVNLIVGGDIAMDMRAGMAARELPDVWSTHGQAITTYVDFLRPMNDRPWFDDVDPATRVFLTDPDGNYLGLPVNYGVGVLNYNIEVLEAAGVDPTSIRTWDDVVRVSEQIRDRTDAAPFGVAGGDSWTFGVWGNPAASAFMVAREDRGDEIGEALKNGTYDFAEWLDFAEFFRDFYENGLLNEDALQASFGDLIEYFATGRLAFFPFEPAIIASAQQVNPDFQGGFIALPSSRSQDSMFKNVGERVTLGVWKDTPRMELALEFVDFMARPENANRIAAAEKLPVGLVGGDYASDFAELAPYYQAIEDVRAQNNFDREFLPGLWTPFVDSLVSIVDGSRTPAESTEFFQTQWSNRF